MGIYEGDVDVGAAKKFLEAAASDLDVVTCVLDAALTTDRGWIVVESNATWGAGLNGCDPADVLDCIDAATTTAA